MTLSPLRVSGIAEADDPRWHDAVALRNATGHFVGELSFRKPDGARVEAEVVSNIYLDSTGRMRAGSIIRDITDRRRVDAQKAGEHAVLEALAKVCRCAKR